MRRLGTAGGDRQGRRSSSPPRRTRASSPATSSSSTAAGPPTATCPSDAAPRAGGGERLRRDPRGAPDRADRDDSDPGPARARLPRQPLPDDAPLHDRHARPCGRARGRGVRRATRTRDCSRSTRSCSEEIAPALAGEDAMAIERCWELARPATFDILRDRRLGLVASAGVDAAIWDLVGKALGRAAVAALGRLPQEAPDDRHRRLLRHARLDRRRGRGPSLARAGRD